MKYILHMSDIHFGYGDLTCDYFDLIDEIIVQKQHQADDIIIVITGDIVDDANDLENYKQAKKGLDILRGAGFNNILLVPGNHDYGTGSNGNKKFVKIYKEIFFGSEVEFPKLDIIDDIALIGLDSMSSELHWYDHVWAEGELGKRQLLDLDKILRSEEVCSCKKRIIYLHHHPFKWRPLHQLKDSKKLKKILNSIIQDGISVDALLFGHNHQGHEHNGTWGIPRCYDAGTATLKSRPKCINNSRWFKVKSSTRFIDIENDDVLSDCLLKLM